MKKIFKWYILILIIGVFSINIFVQADYDKPVAPTELKTDIIKSANTILDSVYNKRTNKTKYPTLESYIGYLEKVITKLKVLKNTFTSSDFRYVLISYVTSWLKNIKTSVQNEISLNPVNTKTWITETQQESMLTLSWNQTIVWTKTFSSPIVAPTPTSNNQLTTKSYVDTTVSAGGNSWIWWWVCDWKFLYMKITMTEYGTDLWWKSWADEKCNSEYPGYHFCHMTEFTKAWNEWCLSNPASYVYPFSFNAPSIDDDTNNCNNRSATDSSFFSSKLIPRVSEWKHYKTFCSSARIVCCKLEK
jgi:hypothetical protein